MKECPNCAVDIDEAATACPICGYEYGTRPVFPWKPVAVIVVLVLLIPVVIQVFRLLFR